MTSKGSAAGRPTRSSAPSCARARNRWPPCSWSRCRTRAGASRRRPATSPGSARSATATACILVSDEVICAFGRLGYYFGSERYHYQPDIITFAKGVTSGYAPLGGMMVSDRLMEPFSSGTATFLHGVTFAGHPVSSAVALANLDVFEQEDLLGNVRANEAAFRATLEKLYDLPIVGDVRGDGYFYGIELVKDKATRETFSDDESERLLRGFLSQALFDAGLICRADDRGDPVIQLAPPADLRP